MQFLIIAFALFLFCFLLLSFFALPYIKDDETINIRALSIQHASRLENLLNKQDVHLLDLALQFMQFPEKYNWNAITPDRSQPAHFIFDSIHLISSNKSVYSYYVSPDTKVSEEKIKNFAANLFTQKTNDIHSELLWTCHLSYKTPAAPSCARIIKSGKFLVIAEISFQRFSDLTVKQNFPDNIFILDKQNKLIAANTDISILHSQSKHIDYPDQLAVLSPTNDPHVFLLNDKKVKGIKVSLKDHPFSLLVKMPEKKVFDNFWPLFLIALLFIVFSIIFAFVFGIFFSRTLNKHLSSLIRNIGEITKGRNCTHINNSHIREIEQLYHTIYKAGQTIHERETSYNLILSQYRDMTKAVENIVITLDQELTITQTNDIAFRIFGLKPEECIGMSFLDFVPHDDVSGIKSRHHMWINQEIDSVIVEDLLVDKNGQYHTVIWDITVNRDEDNRCTGFIGIGHEYTSWKSMQEKLQQIALAYQANTEAIIIADEKDRIILVNPAFEKITGYSSEDIQSSHPLTLVSLFPGKDFMEEYLDADGNWQGELWNTRKNGERYAIRLTIHTLFGSNNNVFRRIAYFSDITEQKLSEKIIWNQNYLDNLTGLPNRNFLKQEISHAIQINMPIALMFLDLDGFKNSNETLTPAASDILLQKVAARLQNGIEKSSIVTRFGRSEFAILSKNLLHLEQIEELGKTILSRLAKPFLIHNSAIHISASIGIISYPDDATDVDDILKYADQAMYASRQKEKDKLYYLNQSLQERVKARMQLMNEFRDVLEKGQLEIMYQPIVDIETGLIRKAESFIRWDHPTRGSINPADFISFAEDSEMIASFGNRIFQEAANQVLVWRQRFLPDFQISINVSPVLFRSGGIDFVNWLSHLKALNLPGQSLIIEITESLFLEPADEIKQQLFTIKNAGMEIALGDFGVGYSSLSHLHKFNFDYLKINQCLIKNLMQEENQILYESIILMAHKLNLKVIAEDVETIRQREVLVNALCDFGQGYLYSTPLPATEFELILENNIQLFELTLRADMA